MLNSLAVLPLFFSLYIFAKNIITGITGDQHQIKIAAKLAFFNFMLYMWGVFLGLILYITGVLEHFSIGTLLGAIVLVGIWFGFAYIWLWGEAWDDMFAVYKGQKGQKAGLNAAGESRLAQLHRKFMWENTLSLLQTMFLWGHTEKVMTAFLVTSYGLLAVMPLGWGLAWFIINFCKHKKGTKLDDLANLLGWGLVYPVIAVVNLVR